MRDGLESTALRTWILFVFVQTMGLYWLWIFPLVRWELRRWQAHAGAIPHEGVRRLALEKLRSEGVLAEGVAAFALLAVAPHRRHVVRLCVAFEVMYDFLDGLTELPTSGLLAHNRQLLHALGDAVTLEPSAPRDYYRHRRDLDDGGYLETLVDTCRRLLMPMPAAAAVAAPLERTAALAATAQCLNHAGTYCGYGMLAKWAVRQEVTATAGLHWWETAAAAGAPLGVHALFAAASDGATTDGEGDAIERTYFPWVGGLLGLLESAVDQAEDLRTGNHSYVSHYPSTAAAGERIDLVARCAARESRALRRAARHIVILTGMVGMNLSHVGASEPGVSQALGGARDAMSGMLLRPLLVALRLRRRLRSCSVAACG